MTTKIEPTVEKWERDFKSIIDSSWNGNRGDYCLSTYQVEQLRVLFTNLLPGESDVEFDNKNQCDNLITIVDDAYKLGDEDWEKKYGDVAYQEVFERKYKEQLAHSVQEARAEERERIKSKINNHINFHENDEDSHELYRDGNINGLKLALSTLNTKEGV